MTDPEAQPIVLQPGDSIPLAGEGGLHTIEAKIAAGATRPQPGADDLHRISLVLHLREEPGLRLRSNEIRLRVVAGE